MKNIVILLILLTGYYALQAQEKEPNYIEVNGSAEKEFTPDKIILKIVITEKENKRKGSLEEQEKDFFERLRKIGIDPQKNIEIDNIESSMEKFFLRKNNVALTKSYILTIKNSTQLTLLFEELEEAEITDVNIISTELSNIMEAAAIVITEAASNARINALSIAEGLGVKMGKAIYAHSYSNFRGQQQIMTKYSRGIELNEAAEDAVVREIPEFRKIKLSHTVTVRFSLE